MEKEKQFTEAEVEAQLEQERIAFKKPYYVDRFTVRPTTCRNAAKFGTYAVRQVDVESATKPNLIAAARINLKLQCKAVSVTLLSDSRFFGILGRIKLFFLFQIHWRLLYGKLDSSDINQLLMAMVEKQGLRFFFANMALVKQMSSLTKKPTKEEAQLLQAEQK